MGRERRSTSSSAFGLSGQEARNATEFYGRFPAPTVSADDVLGDAGAADKLSPTWEPGVR